MLTGTDLSYAYVYELEQPKKMETPPPPQPVNIKEEPVIKREPTTMSSSTSQPLDPNFLTADQKLHLLSMELRKQKDQLDKSKENSYLDKMLSKKKDVMKLLLFALVILLAISIHYVVDVYIRRFIDENVLSSGKEFAFRILYPFLILLILWNMKVFNR